MIPVFYSIISTIFLTIFITIASIQIKALDFYHQNLQAQQSQTQHEQQQSQAIAYIPPQPNIKSQNTFIYEQIKGEVMGTQSAQISTPTPEPTLEDTTYTDDNYVLEPTDREGFFDLKYAPAEPMSTVSELNQAVNEFRKAHGQNWLEIDSGLCSFADRRAHEISEDFSHDGFSKYFESEGIDTWGFTAFGENIWMGEFMGVHIVEYGWVKSPGHYEALVGEWTKGCAEIYDKYAVFIFAR